ncbi:MAG: HNH endonuclease [Luteolibacter sp.]
MKAPGDMNRNRQQLLRITEARGTDDNAKVWVLKCRDCRHIYGCNSTDAFQRKCPKCQQGAAGLPISTERDGKGWTYEEHLIAFELYNRIPFGSIHMRNPKVIELAALLGRKVGSASLKLANFSRFDPVLQARGIKGLARGAKGEAEIWQEFAKQPEELILKSERLVASRLGITLEDSTEIETDDLPKEGIEREAVIRIRVNQSFFRRRILSAYDFRCCVTGLTNRTLLNASHILSWAEDEENRLNPKNGLCLNALHDRVFDRHLMWIDRGFEIRFSPLVYKQAKQSKEAEEITEWLTRFEGRKLILPEKFTPSTDFLERHAAKCKKKAR